MKTNEIIIMIIFRDCR